MTTITNAALGARGINTLGPGGSLRPVILAPAQTITADLYDAASPIYRRWQDSGEVDFGGALPVPPVKPTITNKAGGPRGLNIAGASGGFEQVVLPPGGTVNATLSDPANPMYQAWKAAGDVDFGGALP